MGCKCVGRHRRTIFDGARRERNEYIKKKKKRKEKKERKKEGKKILKKKNDKKSNNWLNVLHSKAYQKLLAKWRMLNFIVVFCLFWGFIFFLFFFTFILAKKKKKPERKEIQWNMGLNLFLLHLQKYTVSLSSSSPTDDKGNHIFQCGMVELLTTVSSINFSSFFFYMSEDILVFAICIHLSVLFKIHGLLMQKNTEWCSVDVNVFTQRFLVLLCLSVSPFQWKIMSVHLPLPTDLKIKKSRWIICPWQQDDPFNDHLVGYRISYDIFRYLRKKIQKLILFFIECYWEMLSISFVHWMSSIWSSGLL